ncbi:MAG: trypsin-like peptidase domain-containing protein [candidate division WOR-3 bacterium]
MGLFLLAVVGAGPDAVGRAVARVMPAVVSINVDRLERRVRPGSAEPELVQVRSLGSGFVFDEHGYVLTCNHVIADYEEVEVRFSDGTVCSGPEVRVVGRDPVTDLAVLKLEADRSMVAVEFADSDSLVIGQWVAAVGNPYGLAGSVTAGVVSGLERWGLSKASGPDFQDFIQTDALINPGNSGGPLIDMDGRVVGVSSFTRKSDQRGFSGIGFAIPANLARDVAGQLVRHGVVIRGYLGINTQPVTEGIRAALRLVDKSGALVAAVAPQSPAARCGLRPGDLVVGLNGQTVPDVRWLQDELASHKPQDTVRILVQRSDRRFETEAVLAAWPVAAAGPQRAPQARNWLGLVVRDIDDLTRLRTRVDNGVVIQAIEPASAGDNAGLLEGDVIVEINLVPVRDKRAFGLLAAKLTKSERPVLVRVVRGSTALYVAVQP